MACFSISDSIPPTYRDRATVSVREWLNITGLSRQTFYRLLARGFPSIQISRKSRILIPLAGSLQWLVENYGRGSLVTPKKKRSRGGKGGAR